MVTRSQRVRLGIFLVVALGILIGLIISVIGASFFAERDRYVVKYDISVSGLEVGAPVKYNGVRVGRVESIGIDPVQVRQTVVTLSLQPGTPVKSDARAVLAVQGITGLKFIEIVGGTSAAETLAPGSEIPAGSSVVDKLTGQAENIALKAEILVDQLLQLTSDNNRALLGDLLERGAAVLGTADDWLKRNSASLDRSMEALSQAAIRLVGVMEELRQLLREGRETVAAVKKAALLLGDEKKLASIMENLQAASAEVRQRTGKEGLGRVLALLEQTSIRAQSLLEKLDMLVAGARDDLRSSIRHLAETAENFRDFSRIVREDPSVLLRQREKRERVLP